MEIVIQMKELRGIITLHSRLVEVRSERGLCMKRLVIGIVIIWLILLTMWFFTTGSPS